MFERFTEKARRAVFFSRYEASQYGSPYIEPEHLLLGLLRENRELIRLLTSITGESIRKQIDARSLVRQPISTSIDLPLSRECQRIFAYSEEEAERLGHKWIGTEHLCLGLFREKTSFAAEILRKHGFAPDQLRDRLAFSGENTEVRRVRLPVADKSVVVIHDCARDIESLRMRVRTLRKFNWYWQKRPWRAGDLAAHKDGRFSFDHSLTTTAENFELQKGAWQKDQCAICRWELFESDAQPDHGIAYTNGREWVCTECHEKFLEGPDFFTTAHPEIT